MSYELVIGNKAASSWSLRPWVLMKAFDIPFAETMVRLRLPSFRTEVVKHSPSGLVPCLKDGDRAVWDTLAIAEYLAEQHPAKNLWPEDVEARAFARCITAEMHSGFGNLRTVWPMDLSRAQAGLICPPGVQKDLVRIFDLWTEARERFGDGGPFLFGTYSIADAFYTPVATRIRTYGPVRMSDAVGAYLAALLDHSAFKEWEDGARQEIADGWYE